MDVDTYETLVERVKQALSNSSKRVQHDVTTLNILIEDCKSVVTQSLDLITDALLNTELNIDDLSKYLNNAACLLFMLADFIKIVITDLIPTRYCQINVLTTAMGELILYVFIHCKDSKHLYKNNIENVERELQILFKNCQMLQSEYLQILEKHSGFNEEFEGKDILLNALDINLKIGNVVEEIDVKTMAMQLKSFINICEKYSDMLMDTTVFEDCMEVLCALSKKNIQTIVETEDNKMMARSLKVTNFILKLILKICDVFKNAKRKTYENIVTMIYYIHEASYLHLEMSDRQNFVDLVVTPSERLMKELLFDEKFTDALLNCEKINKDCSLRFVLTVATVMEHVTKCSTGKPSIKIRLITCLYDFLPHCNLWSKDLPKTIENDKSHSLLEHLLTRTAALAFTLTPEQFCVLETLMIEAILGIDCSVALFSCNLWVLLLMARHINPQLLFNQIVWLCTMFKKLEKHSMFPRSPQKIHMSYTIYRLFEIMENDDKMKICKQFRLHDDDNLSLWAALGVSHLPSETRNIAEDVVVEKLKTQLNSVCKDNNKEDIDKLIKLIYLAATCSFTHKKTDAIEILIIKLWSKTCQTGQFIIQNIEASTIWFYDYLRALTTLTDTMWTKLSTKNYHLVKILHCISELMQQIDDLKLILMGPLCKIAATDISRNKYVDEDFTEAFTCLFQDDIVRNKLIVTLKQYRQDKIVDSVLSNVEVLRKTWDSIKNGELLENESESNNAVLDFSHKCFGIEAKCKVSKPKKDVSGSFEFLEHPDFGDVEEPLNKKMKLDLEPILVRLENDADLLCAVKENVTSEYKNRIQNVCDKLNSI